MTPEPDPSRIAGARARVGALVVIVVIAIAIVGYHVALPNAPLWVDFGLIAGGIAWLVSRRSRR